VGVRPARGGHLLVHRRCGMGDRPQLRGLRDPRQRRDQRDVRGRAEPSAAGPLLGDHRQVRRHDLLHRAHRHPRIHQVGRAVGAEARPLLAPPPGHGRRADQPRGMDVVPRGHRRCRAPRQRGRVPPRGRCRASSPRS
jgi:hypothetical protein